MKLEIQCKWMGFVLLPLLVVPVGVAQTPQQVAVSPPQVANSLKVPAGQVLRLEGKATGVQIYECKKADNANKFAWTLKAPEADLFNDQGKKIIKHYGGPTWEANDGSKVVGAVKASANSPEAGAISWLLLQAKSNDGNGSLSKVTYIQRVNTVGGKAPAQGCDQAHTGAQVRVNYKADYFFWTAK